MSNLKHNPSKSTPRRRLPAATRKAELLYAAVGGDVDEADASRASTIRRRAGRNQESAAGRNGNVAGCEIPVNTVRVRTSSHPPEANCRSTSQSGTGSASEPARDVFVAATSLQEAIAAAMMRAMDPGSSPNHGDGGTLRLATLPPVREPTDSAKARGSGPVVAFRPGPETVQAIITAAAIIACADGQVSDVERRSLLDFLRRKGILEREGRAAATAAFDQAVALAVTLGLDEACAAVDSLRALAERPGAPMVAHAATLVALADGVGWPQEIALLEVIRDKLGLRLRSRRDADDVLH